MQVSASCSRYIAADPAAQCDARMQLEHVKRSFRQRYESSKPLMESNDVAVLKAEGERLRREFVEAACLEPPAQVRLIDCHASSLQNQVVLVDWQHMEFAAISHTFGMEVYQVFDCECTAKCLAKVPRCSGRPCPTHAAPSDPRNRVVHDILNMCAILKVSGVAYAWHDGVCIAQHDEEEVKDAIMHIGWIYANARETIIFLHYVGSPMAPIRPDGDLTSRWQTRVWTLQEGALSRRRRYCVRVGVDAADGGGGAAAALVDCKTLQDLEERIAGWYRQSSSKVTVMEEEAFWKMVSELHFLTMRFCTDDALVDPSLLWKAWAWADCMCGWVQTLIHTCFQFPTISAALDFCSSRESKHVGDRINSILALAGVKDFVAHKDDNMETSTREFFKRQGPQGLARAAFTANFGTLKDTDVGQHGRRQHTWTPLLSSPLRTVYDSPKEWSGTTSSWSSAVEKFIDFTVLEDGKLQLRGEMVCIAVKFTYNINAVTTTPPHEVQQENTDGARRSDVGKHHIRKLLVVRRDVGSADNSLMLAVDLSHAGDFGFSATLAQAASLALGTAVIPMVNIDEEILSRGRESLNIPNVADHFAAIEATASTLKPGWMVGVDAADWQLVEVSEVVSLGFAMLPFLSSSKCLGPVVEGREVQDLWVHMVLPLQPLTYILQQYASAAAHPRPSSSTHELITPPAWDCRVPALLVQGDLTAPVSKIGCFDLHKQLIDILLVLLPCLTHIQTLVII